MTVSHQESAASLDEMIAKVLTLSSQKGGVTKSTTSAQIGAEAARLGLRVLMIDNDSGRGLSVLTRTAQPTSRGADESKLVYEARVAPIRAASVEGFIADAGENASAVVHEAAEEWQPSADLEWKRGGQLLPGGCVHVIPSPGKFLEGIAQQSHGMPALRLRNALLNSGLWKSYDLIIIDTNPSVGMLTQMGIAAAGWVLFPVEPELLAASGYQQGVEVALDAAKELLHPLAIAGTVMGKVGNNNEHRENRASIVGWVNRTFPSEAQGYPEDDPRRAFAAGVWEPAIPNSTMVSTANGYCMPVYRMLDTLLTKKGEPLMGTTPQTNLAIVAGFVKFALNVYALVDPDRYWDVYDALEATDMPDIMRTTIFKSPGRITLEGDE